MLWLWQYILCNYGEEEEFRFWIERKEREEKERKKERGRLYKDFNGIMNLWNNIDFRRTAEILLISAYMI